MDWFGKTFQIVEKSQKTNWKTAGIVNIKDWVEMQVPTMGKPGHKDDEKGQILAYDATVWDWKWDGNKALGERESTAPNPKYPAAAKWEDSTRPAMLFEAKTGKVSFPLVKPHFGKRDDVPTEPQSARPGWR